MTEMNEKLPLLGAVRCVLCSREYRREETEKYRPLGAFENHCLCERCLYKDKHGTEPPEQ